MSWEDDLKAWSEDRAGEAPTAAEAEALVSRAGGGRARSQQSRWVAMALVAAALAVVVVVGARLTAPAEIAEPLANEAPQERGERGQSPWLAPGEVEVVAGEYVVTVGESSQVRVREDGGLLLHAGGLEVSTLPRWEGAPISVRVDEWEVRGLNAGFSVKASPFEVWVTMGSVEVVVGETVSRLRAGEWFTGGRVVTAEALEEEVQALTPVAPVPALVPLSELRGLVLAGDLAAAREGLAARIAGGDLEAAALLAKGEERGGNVAAAVAAWAVVIEAGGTAAQEARYRSAVLLEGQAVEAEVLLRAFLETGDPLAAEARLRLGQALLAQGRTAEARVVLERVIAEHPGGTPARVARERLEEL